MIEKELLGLVETMNFFSRMNDIQHAIDGISLWWKSWGLFHAQIDQWTFIFLSELVSFKRHVAAIL